MSGSFRSIEVASPGLQTTVQDLGRPGFGPMGVSASGAADAVALRIGNLLVGNPEGSAALEMTLTGPVLHFPQGATVALTGSDFAAGLPLWTACALAPGSTLRCGTSLSGARGYVCVRGGIAVELFLGSASTHLLTGLGGMVLGKGSVLKIGPEPDTPMRTVKMHALRRFSYRKVLRATEGPQSDWFTQDFYHPTYRVTEEANRMGLRLEGAVFPVNDPGRMITEGVSLGAIQIAAGGQPIIMFVEQQTTGGYPKIANIIAADLSSLGQLRPRDEIRFAKVSFTEARDLLEKQERLLTSGALFA